MSSSVDSSISSCTTYSPKSSSQSSRSSQQSLSSNTSSNCTSGETKCMDAPQQVPRTSQGDRKSEHSDSIKVTGSLPLDAEGHNSSQCISTGQSSQLQEEELSQEIPHHLDHSTESTSGHPADNSSKITEDDSNVKSPGNHHSHLSEDLASQDLFKNRSIHATSTPFLHNGPKAERTAFNSLQLSGGSSEASPGLKSNPTDSLDKSKPIMPYLLSSPSEVIEKKLNFSSPMSGDVRDKVEKIASPDTLEIPQWCEGKEAVPEAPAVDASLDVDLPYSQIVEDPSNSVVVKKDVHMEDINCGQRKSSSSDDEVARKDSNHDNYDSEFSKPSSPITSSSVPDIFNPRDSMGSERRSMEDSQQSSARSVYDDLPDMNFDLSAGSDEESEKNAGSFTSVQNVEQMKQNDLCTSTVSTVGSDVRTSEQNVETVEQERVLSSTPSEALIEQEPSCSKTAPATPATPDIPVTLAITVTPATRVTPATPVTSAMPLKPATPVTPAAPKAPATPATPVAVEENGNDTSNCETSFDGNVTDIDFCVYKVGMKVFALWNKIFYPGEILSIDDSATVTIHFHDDQVVMMPKRNVFSHNFFSEGQRTRVKLPGEEYYENATILHSLQHNNDIRYTVYINDQYHCVSRNCICFTQGQRQNLLLASNNMAFVADSNSNLHPSNVYIDVRKRRMTEPLYSTGSDVFIAMPPAKKSKKTMNPVKLFEGLTFYIIPDDALVLCPLPSASISSVDESQGESQDEASSDFIFNVGDLKEKLTSNGGVVIEKLYGRDIMKASKFVMIAKSEMLCLPFVYGVVMGTPVLHFDWVHRSLEEKKLRPYEKGEYVLPAGRDITGEIVEQDITRRVPYTPLNIVRFYIHMDGELRNQNRLLDLLMSRVGCQRMFSSMYVTRKSKKIQFDIKQVDFVLTLVEAVPRTLVDAAAVANIPIVTATWFVQCLINNQLFDVADSPAFTYKDELGDTSLNELDTTG